MKSGLSKMVVVYTEGFEVDSGVFVEGQMVVVIVID
jgi:hypothetical protein